MSKQDGRKTITMTRENLIIAFGLTSFAGFTIGYISHGLKVWSQIGA